MRFYKNILNTDDKFAKSFEIYLDSDYESLLEEIHDGIESNVKDISEKILSSVSINHAVEQKKNVLVYFYKDGLVSLHFKALSTVPIL